MDFPSSTLATTTAAATTSSSPRFRSTSQSSIPHSSPQPSTPTPTLHSYSRRQLQHQLQQSQQQWNLMSSPSSNGRNRTISNINTNNNTTTSTPSSSSPYQTNNNSNNIAPPPSSSSPSASTSSAALALAAATNPASAAVLAQLCYNPSSSTTTSPSSRSIAAAVTAATTTDVGHVAIPIRNQFLHRAAILSNHESSSSPSVAAATVAAAPVVGRRNSLIHQTSNTDTTTAANNNTNTTTTSSMEQHLNLLIQDRIREVRQRQRYLSRNNNDNIPSSQGETSPFESNNNTNTTTSSVEQHVNSLIQERIRHARQTQRFLSRRNSNNNINSSSHNNSNIDNDNIPSSQGETSPFEFLEYNSITQQQQQHDEQQTSNPLQQYTTTTHNSYTPSEAAAALLETDSLWPDSHDVHDDDVLSVDSQLFNTSSAAVSFNARGGENSGSGSSGSSSSSSSSVGGDTSTSISLRRRSASAAAAASAAARWRQRHLPEEENQLRLNHMSARARRMICTTGTGFTSALSQEEEEEEGGEQNIEVHGNQLDIFSGSSSSSDSSDSDDVCEETLQRNNGDENTLTSRMTRSRAVAAAAADVASVASSTHGIHNGNWTRSTSLSSPRHRLGLDTSRTSAVAVSASASPSAATIAAFSSSAHAMSSQRARQCPFRNAAAVDLESGNPSRVTRRSSRRRYTNGNRAAMAAAAIELASRPRSHPNTRAYRKRNLDEIARRINESSTQTPSPPSKRIALERKFPASSENEPSKSSDHEVTTKSKVKQGEDSNQDDESKKCCICLDIPKHSELAQLDGCSHPYCFDCIAQWAERENTCPQCKSRFSEIKRVNKMKKKRGKGSPIGGESCSSSMNVKKVKDRDQGSDYRSQNHLQSLLAQMEVHGLNILLSSTFNDPVHAFMQHDQTRIGVRTRSSRVIPGASISRARMPTLGSISRPSASSALAHILRRSRLSSTELQGSPQASATNEESNSPLPPSFIPRRSTRTLTRRAVRYNGGESALNTNNSGSAGAGSMFYHAMPLPRRDSNLSTAATTNNRLGVASAARQTSPLSSLSTSHRNNNVLSLSDELLPTDPLFSAQQPRSFATNSNQFGAGVSADTPLEILDDSDDDSDIQVF